MSLFLSPVTGCQHGQLRRVWHTLCADNFLDSTFMNEEELCRKSSCPRPVGARRKRKKKEMAVAAAAAARLIDFVKEGKRREVRPHWWWSSTSNQHGEDCSITCFCMELFFFFYYYFLVSIVGCVWGGKKRGPHCPPPLLEVGSKMDREVHGQVPLSLVLLWKVGTSILPWESSRVSSLRQADRTPPLLAFRSRPAWRRCLARSILVVGS